MDILGDWIHNVSVLSNEYTNAIPYEHVVIKHFFKEDYIRRLISKFPQIDEKWYKYDNPLERKYARNQFDDLPEYKEIFEILQKEEIVSLISQITGIHNLENDPHLHGAGIHSYPSRGKLDIHLDYSIHPITGKERRVNLIIYLNEYWENAYNGDLQLWNEDFTGSVKQYYPEFNTAILFKTNDISYHGLPTPMKCPEHISRNSLAIYYVSPPTENATHRYKAEYRKLPWQPITPGLEELYKIRKTRIITNDDLEKLYPNWRSDGNGYW